MQRLDESTPAHADTAVARLLSVWRITLDTWSLSGRSLPDYERADAPTRWRRLGDD
jgi:hypothetical protein